MGRQAYLTRLALGRSPFEEPELTESGEFILGSHAHDLDNHVDGYVQQFDNRGQPKNPAAKAAAREFRHAKNEVMEAMGAVKRKGIQEIKRQKSADKQNMAALLRENSYGPWLKALDSGLGALALWWLMSLRSRYQTFASFSGLPLLEIIRSDIRLLGPLAFLSSGLLTWFVTMPITFCRHSLVDIVADSIVHEVTSGAEDAVSHRCYATGLQVLCQVLDFTLFAIAAPVLMFSDLQTLHLIPYMMRPSLSSLIPFTRNSPIRLHSFPRPGSPSEMLQSGLKVLQSPLVIFWLYVRVRHAVEAVNYRIVCATIPRPNFPDRWSVLAADKGDDDGETIPGLWLEHRSTLPQQLLYEAERLLDRFRRWKAWGREERESASLEEGIRFQSLAIEREILFGPATAHRSRPTQNMAREVQRHAARLSWEVQGQTPPDDIDAWIDIPQTRQTSSTNTPEPEELFTTVEVDDIGEGSNDSLPRLELITEALSPEPSEHNARPADIPNPAESPDAEASTRGQTQPQPTFPTDHDDAFWQHFLNGYTADVVTSNGRLQRWENPDEHSTPPPVRRARTLTSDDVISRAVSRSESRYREPLRRRGWARKARRHRVTTLSNYPADAFAYYVSMVLTTVMVLPFESLYLRALARGFLESPTTRPGAVAAAAEIRADVRGLGDWFGGSERGLKGRMRYAGVMVLIWGMQAVISAGVWGLGTSAAIWIGRRNFGWGRN